MADLYSNYLDSLLNQLDDQYKRKIGELQTMFSQQGILQTPKATEYFGDIQNQYMSQVSPLLAQAGIDQRKYQDDLMRWEKAFQAQQAQTAQGNYMQQAQLSEAQKQNAFNQQMALRQQELAENQLSTQQQAMANQQQNWWQEPVGDLAALALYGAVPWASLIPGAGNLIKSGVNAVGNWFSPQQSPSSTSQYYQPGVGTDPNAQYEYKPSQFMQIKW